MKAPQAAAPPQTWSAPCRHLLTYFCRLLTHHWHTRARVGAHGHEIKYLLRPPSVSLCCQMQRAFFSSPHLFMFFVQSSATASHAARYIQNADATPRAGILNWGRLERRLPCRCAIRCICSTAGGTPKKKKASLTAHSADGNLLKLKKNKNMLYCWKRRAVHRGRQARWHLLAACTKKKKKMHRGNIQNSFSKLTNRKKTKTKMCAFHKSACSGSVFKQPSSSRWLTFRRHETRTTPDKKVTWRAIGPMAFKQSFSHHSRFCLNKLLEMKKWPQVACLYFHDISLSSTGWTLFLFHTFHLYIVHSV